VLLGEIIENRGNTMDFMFEDDVDEVGSDVEAYCPKCKADTTHVVISKYEDEIRRVQCNPCGDVHSFRKPRGEAEEDMPEPVAARKRALLKKLTWDEFFAKHGEKNAKPYEFRDTYRENVILFHPKFGKGYVSEVVSESKVEITFKDARRILVHNRKDIPGSPVGSEDDGLPSTPVPVKGGARGAAKSAEKRAAKPVPAGKVAPAAKVVAKKGEDKKGEDKKSDDKKSDDKKPVAKQPAPRQQPVAKKPVTKQPVAKKLVTKKPAPKKAPAAKKPAPKRVPVAKKPAPKKAPAAKKPAPKKAPAAKKPVAKKPAPKKHK
jgi:hypothetical protein